MPIYFFHLQNDVDILLDPEGRELESERVAAAALQEARAIIAADARSGCIDLKQNIHVKDSTGKLVCRVEFEDAVELIRDAAHGG
jgi:hypothetical protein